MVVHLEAGLCLHVNLSLSCCFLGSIDRGYVLIAREITKAVSRTLAVHL